jgi:hypothetical protein
MKAVQDVIITKTEVFDVDMMYKLLRHEGVSIQDKKRMKAYRDRRNNGNHVDVSYVFGEHYSTIKKGRLFARHRLGCEGFPRDIRACLFEKYYWDVDMENAQPVLLTTLSARFNLSCPALDEYCSRRNEVLDELMASHRLTRDEAKTVCISVIFGGFRDDHPLLPRMFTELKALALLVSDANPELYAVAKKDKETKVNQNPAGSCLAVYIQNEERLILTEIDTFLTTKGRSMEGLIHDGGLVRKLEDEQTFPASLLRDVEQHIFDTTRYRISLAVKPMKHTFSFKVRDTLLPSTVKLNDDYAAKVFAGLAGARLKKVKGVLYGFNDDTGLWTEDLLPLIHEFKDDLYFEQMQGSLFKVADYGGMAAKMDPMLKLTPNYVPESTLDAESTIGKLLWKDGWYDFETDTFHDTFSPDLFFAGRINRPFPKVRDQEAIQLVHKVLFEDPYLDEQQEQRDFYKIALARALYGDYRAKRCYFTTGRANCGRGLLTAALQSSFEGFVTQFSSEQLLYNSRTASDPAKQMAWVIPFRDARIAIANEISMSEKFIDGNRLKGISSGGDQIQARLNFKDEQLYTIRATLFCLTNDIPQIKPAEEGLLNRICINELKKVYVKTPEPSNKYQAKEDRTLKDKFNQDTYKDALFFLLADEWKKFVAMGRQSEKPASVQAGIQEWVETGVSVQNILSDKYEFTKLEDHTVRFDDLEKLLRQKDCKDSTTKIGRELTRLTGHEGFQKKVNGRLVSIRRGIRLLEDDPVIE